MYDNNADSNGSDDGFDSVPPAKRQKPTTCLSITTLTFNIIYLILGIGIAALGVLLLILVSNLGRITDLFITTAMFTSLGFFFIFLSILGIVGISRKNRQVLICFAFFLILLLATETVTGIVLIAKPDIMMPSVKKQYFYLVNMVTGDSSAPKILHLRAELAKWYEENDCCGYDGPLDFQNPQDICCTFAFDCNLDGYSGCKDIIRSKVENNSRITGGIALAFLPFPITFVICVILLIRRL
ncbi:unnamed protein product [Hymenolepis diminuta]|uniref:Tetraspanin n=1 Tax=Hymenolepis diminuta TaxID=6216 RepID=A0A564Z2I3_HYMDI|nr:unnamed protein product [Hymenolepis diminuta]